jgi:hypothetical protein
VPGVIVAARWYLLAPLIMLEGQFVGAARERSAKLVRGHTPTVALIVAVTFVLTNMIFWPVGFVLDSSIPLPARDRLQLRHGAVQRTRPDGPVLPVTEPAQPVVHEDVRRWTSVWAGPTTEG